MTIETIRNARQLLNTHVRRFRDEGVDAEPVVFGDHRRPEAVMLPYETFELLLDVAEDIAIAQRIRDRDAADSGNRTSLGDLATELGIDLDAL